ncbi:Mixed lineage kinase domain-like protein [Channa argus]|uniref:Mixed lineage kinase domain-like protein n=1 Tax=Channa argus TaxID=215402 RepID=A0A6G1QUA5_CHAAH|nr:Mixed lineage kinase domain-like protein [Channa argus]
MIPVSAILSICKAIYVMGDKATTNKDYCKRVVQRVKALEELVLTIEKRGPGQISSTVANALTELSHTLDSAMDLVKTFSQSNSVKRFIKSKSHENKFSQVNEKLTQCFQILSGALQIEQGNMLSKVLEVVSEKRQDERQPPTSPTGLIPLPMPVADPRAQMSPPMPEPYPAAQMPPPMQFADPSAEASAPMPVADPRAEKSPPTPEPYPAAQMPPPMQFADPSAEASAPMPVAEFTAQMSLPMPLADPVVQMPLPMPVVDPGPQLSHPVPGFNPAAQMPLPMQMPYPTSPMPSPAHSISSSMPMSIHKVTTPMYCMNSPMVASTSIKPMVLPGTMTQIPFSNTFVSQPVPHNPVNGSMMTTMYAPGTMAPFPRLVSPSSTLQLGTVSACIRSFLR